MHADRTWAERIARSLQQIQGADERERDKGEYAACEDCSKHVQDYVQRPLDIPGWEEIRPWFNLAPDALKLAAEASPAKFGAYRNLVLDYEARCAKQLAALVWAAQVLYRLHDKPNANKAKLEALIEPINDALGSWRAPHDIFALAKRRGWETEFTRRYDLLPRSWRFV